MSSHNLFITKYSCTKQAQTNSYGCCYKIKRALWFSKIHGFPKGYLGVVGVFHVINGCF